MTFAGKRMRSATVAFAIALAFADGAQAADALDRIGGALDRTGAYIGRKLGVGNGSASDAGRAVHRAALIEESRPPAVATASRAAAASTLREGLARLDRATTPAERDAADAMVVDAAERGDPDAQYMLGAGDLLRPTDERDPTRAAGWLARAAAQGHARAQYALAQAYIDGDGVVRDPAWANMWLARAARRGHTPAQQALGLREIAGEGWPVDDADAYRWLTTAVEAGYVDAGPYREALGKRLAADQRLLLDAEAAAFRPVTGPDLWPDPPLVRFVQLALAARDLDPGPADGTLGPRTREAVKRFTGGGDGALTPALVARLRNR